MNFRENPLAAAFLGIAMGGDTEGAYETTVELSQRMDADLKQGTTVRVPDLPRSRQALEAWGITWEEGTPISRMFGDSPCLAANVPAGWKHERVGAWNFLVDDMGRNRLRWYIHGWDPISVQTCNRFSFKNKDLSARERVYYVMDGLNPIHIIRVNYPYERPDQREPGEEEPYWRFSYNGKDDDKQEANYQAEKEAEEQARTWLNEQYPDWREDIKSFSM